MWASCVCNAWADEPRFNQNQTGTTNTQSTTAQALYKNSLYKKMRGWIFLPHICFVEYIYIYMQMEDKKLRDPGIFTAKQIRCMWRSPFAPLLNFLNHEMVYKDSIRSGKWSQPPLEPNTRQNELCTTTAWLGMTSKKPDQPRVEPLDGHEVWR